MLMSKKNGKLARPKATVWFSNQAWAKMLTLIAGTDREVGWHGTCHSDKNGEYFIDDIMIYPQTVSSTSVRVDSEIYSKWLLDKIANENKDTGLLRFHAHSHVNMATLPSGTDLDLQKDNFAGLDENGYYIFLIINKSLDMNFAIEDNRNGHIRYEFEEVAIGVLDNEAQYKNMLIGLKNEYADNVKLSYHSYPKGKETIRKNNDIKQMSVEHPSCDDYDTWYFQEREDDEFR